MQRGEPFGELAAVTARYRIPAPVPALKYALQPFGVGGKILRPDRKRPATHCSPAQNCQFTHIRKFSPSVLDEFVIQPHVVWQQERRAVSKL